MIQIFHLHKYMGFYKFLYSIFFRIFKLILIVIWRFFNFLRGFGDFKFRIILAILILSNILYRSTIWILYFDHSPLQLPVHHRSVCTTAHRRDVHRNISSESVFITLDVHWCATREQRAGRVHRAWLNPHDGDGMGGMSDCVWSTTSQTFYCLSGLNLLDSGDKL